MKKTAREMELSRLRNPNFPDKYRATTRNKKSPANELTHQIMVQIKLDGGFAARVNTTGTYSTKLKRFITSGATKGAADIQATYKGRTVQIEVKIAKDKMSEHQLCFQKQIEAAGGTFIIAKTIDSFLMQWSAFKAKIENK